MTSVSGTLVDAASSLVFFVIVNYQDAHPPIFLFCLFCSILIIKFNKKAMSTNLNVMFS